MPVNLNHIENRLWEAADELRAKSKLKSAEYSVPVLGLIFLRFADYKYSQAEKELIDRLPAATSRRRNLSKLDYQARWSRLMQLPESANIGDQRRQARHRGAK